MVFDPNLAYVVLVLAFIFGVLALAAPGTGVLELGAVALMALAGYTLFQLPINSWALILLVAGLPLFFFAVRPTLRWVQWILLVLAILVFAVGSVFMFRSPAGSGLAINPWLAALISLASGVFMWFVFQKSLQANMIPVKQAFSGLEGMEGVAVTEISREGTVLVGSENWSAHSETQIPRHSRVRVISRKGLILEVEEIK
jgi:membrane-bound serine protease (ClpP class)